jgi:hypothetical protein
MAAIGVLVIGQSGTGKSASMRNLPPKGTGVINIAGKRLPFRSSLKCVQKTSGADIIKTLLNGKAEVIVVDDLQYVLVNQFMARASEKTYQWDHLAPTCGNIYLPLVGLPISHE